MARPRRRLGALAAHLPHTVSGQGTDPPVVEEKFRKYRTVLERIWGELTVLGFLALVTFILLQSEATQGRGLHPPIKQSL